ncbi:predicted protein [Aspergillus terreus NIH2624]|uniref:cutinase n=1 Tax=Aspergillus terreus (strain NIH 2624 / FGSC A1156) TaxID=341663 RepID=Q0CZ47_ASPTN|nr:uncharacterized protein ATEG_01037 [Aspergillus terreus NIH2624]EAU37794.1 predicted protein [Aspergillus terreus NIH2624]
MKATFFTLSLLGSALGAPTKTIENRQLGDLSSLGTSSGLGSLASLFPIPSGLSGLGGLGGLGNLLGSGSSTGSIPSLGNLGSLFGSSSSSSSGSGSGLSSLLGGLGGSSTANGVTDKDACQPLTFIFARGTTELGNMGNTVGPAVAEKLKSLTNNKVVIQGVDYAASAAGNAAMGAEGGPQMAQLVQQALKQCANTKVVLGGYSQGAMVVHNAASKLSSGQVSGAVLFGDPFRSQAVENVESSKVKEFCAQGDPVCLNGANVIAHISYGADAEEAAQFLIKSAGV